MNEPGSDLSFTQRKRGGHQVKENASYWLRWGESTPLILFFFLNCRTTMDFIQEELISLPMLNVDTC